MYFVEARVRQNYIIPSMKEEEKCLKKKCFKRVMAGLLSAALIFGLTSKLGTIPDKVKAEGTVPEVRSINLDTSYLTPSGRTWDASDHKGNKDKVPDTGDNVPILWLFALMFVSGICFVELKKTTGRK